MSREADQEAGLVAAVGDRAPGVTVPQALCAYVKRVRIRAVDSDARYADFLDLMKTTPALSDYTHRMWMRHQDALARRADDPERAVDVAFDLLEHGWSAPAPRFGDGRE